MKIISIGPVYPLRGGIAKFNETLSKNLMVEGNKLINFSYRYQYPKFLFPGKSQFDWVSKAPELDIRNELHSVNFLSWPHSYRKIQAESPDIVIVNYWMPFFSMQLIYLLRRLHKQNVKIILLAHNLIPHEKQPGTYFLSKRLLSCIDGLVCLSASVKNDALKFRENLPVLVIPHPVYDVYGDGILKTDALKNLNLDPSFSYILFFGLIRKYKGLDILLKSLPLIKTKGFKLLVAGEFYDKKEEYYSIIDELGIKDMVVFEDHFIPDDKVKDFFSAADLVVQPYRTATQSGVTQIAYHFGLPMIVTKVGGLTEIVKEGKTGYFSEVNPESVAGAIDRFYGQKDRAKMKVEILNKAKSYSWESFTKQILKFVQSV